jgi:hypothetical protein
MGTSDIDSANLIAFILKKTCGIGSPCCLWRPLLFLTSLPQSRQSARPFLQSLELGLPHPSPAGERALPLVQGECTHSLGGEGWGSPNSNEGPDTVVLFVYLYHVLPTIVALKAIIYFPSLADVPDLDGVQLLQKSLLLLVLCLRLCFRRRSWCC